MGERAWRIDLTASRRPPRCARLSSAWTLGTYLLLLLRAAGVWGLDPGKALTQYGHDRWTAEEGLPLSGVEVLAQTTDGYLWVGTEEGIARFDGLRFTTFDQYNTPGLTNHSIRALCPRRNGGIWVGTWGGLFLLQGGKASLVPVVSEEPKVIVEALFEGADGTLWVGTQGYGVVGLGKGPAVRYSVEQGLPHSVIWALQEDRDGTLWIGTHAGLARLRQGKVENLTGTRGVPQCGIGAFSLAPDGTLWIGSGMGALHYAHGGFRLYGKADGLIDTAIDAIWADGRGSVWLGSRRGVMRLLGGRISTFGVDDGLTDGIVRTFQVDPEGSLWIGTKSGGLDRFRDGKFRVYGKPEGLAHASVNTLLVDRTGARWFGTRAGLTRRRNAEVESWRERAGLPVPFVTSLLEARDGTLWVGTAAGVSRSLGPLDPAGKAPRFALFRPDDPYLYTFVSGLVEDRDGGIWIGSSYGGLYRWHGGRLRVFLEPNGEDAFPATCLLLGRDGSVWIGSTGAGLMRYKDGRFERFGAGQGLNDPTVYSLYEDSGGSLWIGTSNGGLNRLRGGRIGAVRAAEGLFDNVILAIQEDALGYLWLGSNRGIARVAKRELEEVMAGRRRSVACTVFGTADGLRGRSVTAGSSPNALRDQAGHLWFATDDSAVEIDALHLPVNRRPPPVEIESLAVDGGASEPAAQTVLPPGSQRIEIGYTALTALAPGRVRFQVRLAGYDPGWVDAGGRRSATYTNLPPGSYSFAVRAANADGVWNPRGAVLPFVLAPRFYQTVWFKLLAALAVVLVLFLLYRLRTGTLAARYEAVVRERTRIARDLHDTLMQGLAGISLQLERAAGGIPDSAPVREPMERARGLVRDTLSAARRSVWSLRAGELEDRDLPQALAAFVETVATPEGPKIEFHTQGTVRPLPDRVEEHLFRIGQEAISNALRHAGARRIEVELDFEEAGLRLRVEDDGRGFAVEGTADGDGERHFGLLGMSDRAGEIAGRLEVRSGVGEGTEVRVRVPLA